MSDNKFLILDKSFGCYKAYDFSVKNAQKLLEMCAETNWKTPVVNDILDNNAEYVSQEAILKVLSKILTEPAGAKASKSIEVTEAYKQEVVMYCFKHNINIKAPGAIDSYSFFKVFKLSDFSFFANNNAYSTAKGVAYLYEMELAKDYRIIVNDNWSEKASERAKVNFILDFIKRVSHRDVEFEVIPYSKDCS